MLCSNTVKNPGTAHKKCASEGISCPLFDNHLSARQYMDNTFCDLFSILPTYSVCEGGGGFKNLP
jgi:hypothetical protein